ncbi:MAG: hypothetical protein ACRDJN_09425 [Chloroflexota bacterium]
MAAIDLAPGTRSRPVARGLTVPTVLSLLAAGLLVVTSVAGLWYGQRGLYTPDPATLPAFLGQDAVTLVAGLPLLLGSMWAARRGSVRGLLLWVGTLFYVAYSYAYYPLNPEFNALYLAYIAIVSLSGYGLLSLLLGTDAEAVRARFSERTPVRLIGGFMAVMGALFALKWVATITAHLMAGTTPTHIDLTVWPMDLVIALPATFWGGVWLWRRQPLGYVVAGLLLLKMALLGCTLVLNTWLVTLWGRPPDPMVPFYATIGLGGLALLVAYLRCVRETSPDPAGGGGHSGSAWDRSSSPAMGDLAAVQGTRAVAVPLLRVFPDAEEARRG